MYGLLQLSYANRFYNFGEILDSVVRYQTLKVDGDCRYNYISKRTLLLLCLVYGKIQMGSLLFLLIQTRIAL